MKITKNEENIKKIKEKLIKLNENYMKSGLSTNELEKNACPIKPNINSTKTFNCFTIIIIALLIYYWLEYGLIETIINYLLGVRCIIPNNYFIWEATRPLSNCNFCLNLTKPIQLNNLTKEEFAQYAYSSKPIIVKKSFLHWPAIKYFNFKFFKELYDSIAGSYQSVDEECQFLHFKSNFISLKDVFSMNQARIENQPGQKSWYVGWGNCHPQILAEMRRYYPKPHFLPDDCEIPSKEYVFMGYDDGATMHLDFINRLMWQAQLKGTKTWHLIPPPECEDVCSKLSFQVEPGDAVLVDTRIWYHGTTISPGEFSLSIQSEYG